MVRRHANAPLGAAPSQIILGPFSPRLARGLVKSRNPSPAWPAWPLVHPTASVPTLRVLDTSAAGGGARRDGPGWAGSLRAATAGPCGVRGAPTHPLQSPPPEWGLRREATRAAA